MPRHATKDAGSICAKGPLFFYFTNPITKKQNNANETPPVHPKQSASKVTLAQALKLG